MGSPRQTSSLVHDPLGLLALPMKSTGRAWPDEVDPPPGINSTQSLGMAIATKTIGAALAAVLVAVSFVALPGPANDGQTVSRTAVWKADEGWCLGALAPFIFASHYPLHELFGPQLRVRRMTRSSP